MTAGVIGGGGVLNRGFIVPCYGLQYARFLDLRVTSLKISLISTAAKQKQTIDRNRPFGSNPILPITTTSDSDSFPDLAYLVPP